MSNGKFVGLLHSGSSAVFAGLVRELKKAVQPELVIDVESYAADPHAKPIDRLAADLVNAATAAGPDNSVVIAAGGPGPALLLQGLTDSVPIVFTTVYDPQDLGLVQNVMRPGFNLTGMAGKTSELDSERLHFLFDLMQGSSTHKIRSNDNIGILVSGNRQKKNKQYNKVDHEARHALGLVPNRMDVTDTRGIIDAFVSFNQLTTPTGQPKPATGVAVMADSLFNDLRADVVRTANGANGPTAIPTIYQWKEFVVAGGLISFGPSITEAYKEAGKYAQRILNGEKPRTMRCSEPTVYEVYVNRTTARTFGVTVPAKLRGYTVN